MNLSSKDIVIFIFGCSVITAASAGLYIDYKSRISTTQTDVIGTITFKKKTAERKYTDQMIWEDVTSQSPVYNNDSIRTAEGSAAAVRLKNGTNIDLDENTLVMFSFSAKGADIDLAGGSILAKTAESGGTSASAVSIRSGGTSVSITNATLNLTKKTDKAVDLSVSSGNAVLSGDAGPVSVGPNQTATVEGGKTDVRKNTVELISPSQNAYVVTSSGKKAPIVFLWKGIGKNSFEIAADRDFKKVIFKKEMISGASENFAKGDFYWRVKSADSSISEVRKFSILEDQATTLLSPQKNSSIFYVESNPLVQLTWSPSMYASSYEVEFSRDGTFNEIVLQLNPFSTTIATDQLKEGVYYWRVRPVYGMLQKSAYSMISSFRVVHNTNALPPETQNPVMNEIKSESAAASEKITFSWTGSADEKDYILELAKDISFSTTVFREFVPAYYYRYVQPLKAGDYYWRVTGRNVQGILSEPSVVMKFTIIKNRPPVSLKSVQETAEAVLITWRDPDRNGRYKVEIAKDAGFLEKVFSSEYSVQSALVKDLAQGDYFYRVSSLDSDKSIVSVSNAERLSVAGVLAPPEVVSPLNNSSVDVIKTRSINFGWKSVPLATGYLLEIYQYSFTSNRLMHSVEITDLKYSFKQLSLLSNGNFYWQITALRKKGQAIYARSEPSKGYFNIPTGPEIKAPKIGNLKVYVE